MSRKSSYLEIVKEATGSCEVSNGMGMECSSCDTQHVIMNCLTIGNVCIMISTDQPKRSMSSCNPLVSIWHYFSDSSIKVVQMAWNEVVNKIGVL